MNDSKISIIMSVYNSEDTLSEAIDSIIEQTYGDWEFIICDDCSTDSTPDILEKYRLQYPDKFILLHNDKNMRLSYSLNRCLEKATGTYIARMDADDRSDPTRFERQLSFLKEHPEIDLVGTAMRRFNESGLADSVVKPEFVDKYSMRKDTPFNHATILTYKKVYDSLNGYTVSPRTVRGQDYDLWFRFFHADYKGYNMPDDLYYVREDMNAIRRRTFKVRWNTFKTTCYGFRLLGFPKWWLIKPFFSMLLKSLVPYRIISMYREYQKGKA